jgi:hypothetical protein
MLKFGICRVLGNDLPPRHHPDQTLKNLEYILSKEGDLPGASKIFHLNRIVEPSKVDKMAKMISDHGHTIIEDPFVLADYRKLQSQEERVLYFTNVNKARNACLDFALTKYDVAVILDGSAFFQPKGWEGFQNMVYERPEDAVYGIGVHRAASISEIESPNFAPVLRERYVFGNGDARIGIREPYLAFTSHADVRFDESLRYGRADKAELLYRLGILGVWDYWEPAMKQQALLPQNRSTWFGTVKIFGYSIRLPSYSSGDGDNEHRGRHRAMGVTSMLKMLENC